MSTDDTWILVAVPGRDGRAPDLGRTATRVGLALLAWGARLRERPARAVDLGRVERPTPVPRPFC